MLLFVNLPPNPMQPDSTESIGSAYLRPMDYWKYTFLTDPDTAEILIAYLADAPFDTFEEHEKGLSAYLPATPPLAPPPSGGESRLSGARSAASSPPDGAGGGVETLLAELQQQFQFAWHKEFLPAQNWNEIWESNFHPVVVGDFCAVRADFHAPIPGVKWELVINPKMAFGTGHHETTWQCIAALEHLPLAGAHVLDYGCGTGILAILASKQGASRLEAVDIEEESYRNTLENCAANGVHNVVARQGTLAEVQGRAFDGILANINRHIILDSLPALADLTKPGGWLLVSGILASDETIVTEAAQMAGFQLKEWKQRGNWLCGVFERRA